MASRIESVANFLVICASIAVLVTAVKSFAGTPDISPVEGPPRGSHLNVAPAPPFDGKTIVLALSPRCHYCSESAAFYKRLISMQAVRGGRESFRVVAVVQGDRTDSVDYMNRLGIGAIPILKQPFGSLGFRSTPTVVVVDRKGVVLNTWVGKLSRPKEAEVVATLDSPPQY